MDAVFTWVERLLDGTLFTGSIFLVVGIVGGVLLLISLLLDGVFDAFDFGDGPLSLTTISAFTAIFGFTAFASIGAGMPPAGASVVGALAGLVGGAAAWWLSRMIRGAESSTAVTGDELVGLQGVVVLAIPASGLGEVALTRHGERISLSASADEPIARGTLVTIVHTVTSTSVRVAPSESSIAATAQQSPPAQPNTEK